MPEPRPFIVGRQEEVERFDQLLTGETSYHLLNIYGPGGIGKTVVGQKLTSHAESRQAPVAMVDGSRPDLTPDRLLFSFMEGLVQTPVGEVLEDVFRDFQREFQDYLVVNQVLQQGGGVQALFNVVGSVKDQSGFVAILDGLGSAITESVRRTVSNRFALERYLRSVERSLTASFVGGLAAGMEAVKQPIALLIDTYEEMEGLDDWLCRTLVAELPDGVRLVILGRNQLYKVNFDWNEHEAAVHTMPLPELGEVEAKAYLRHFGLADASALDQVYRYTGGYPLLLVLVRHLAREAGGWEQIGVLESSADRDRIATKLLERILREERVAEVQSFLEKGVVARWFDPETVSVLLEVNLADARQIYDKLRRHSFVERHPYGLKFHDKIRDLLLDRLKFTSESEYNRLTQRLMNYYAEKAGIEQPGQEQPQTSVQTGGGAYVGRDVDTGGGDFVGRDQVVQGDKIGGSKYNIHIHTARGVAIGAGARAQIAQVLGDARSLKTQSLRIDAAVPEQVYVNRSFNLAVAIRQPSSPKLSEEDLPQTRSGDAQVSWPENIPYLSLRIQVSAPDCVIHGVDTCSFRLYPGQDSPVFFFHLAAQKRGEISIIVTLHQESDWLGSTRLHTQALLEEAVGKVHVKVVSHLLVNRKRCEDLAGHIHDTLHLIKEYEDQRRLTDDPKVKRRADREIADLRSQLAAYEAEQRELGCGESSEG